MLKQSGQVKLIKNEEVLDRMINDRSVFYRRDDIAARETAEAGKVEDGLLRCSVIMSNK